MIVIIIKEIKNWGNSLFSVFSHEKKDPVSITLSVHEIL